MKFTLQSLISLSQLVVALSAGVESLKERKLQGENPLLVAYRLASEMEYAVTAVGDSLSFSVYGADTEESIGYYFDAGTIITHGGGSLVSNSTFECMYHGAYNFNFNESIKADAYGSQIFITGVCDTGARQQAIIGGTNQFACATGTVNIIDEALTAETGEVLGDMLEFMVYGAGCGESVDTAVEKTP